MLALLAGCAGEPPNGPPAPALSRESAWLRDYLRLDTTHEAGTTRGVDFLASILASQGIATERLDAGDGLPSLWAYLPATTTEAAAETLLLLHHIDVVEAAGEWMVPPFAGETRDGELWGRGAIDSKSLGITHLAALIDLAGSAEPRHRAVAFMAVADEERGGALGAQRWLGSRPELFSSVTAVINEGGINRGHDGRLHWWGIEIAQKRPLWLEVRGDPKALVGGLRRVVDRPLAWRVPALTEFTFRRMAPLYNEHWRRIFLDLERFVEPNGPTVMLLPGMETFFLDSIQANVLEILEDGRALARIDARLLPDTDQAEFLASLEGLLGPSLETSVLLSSPPVEPSPWSGPWIEILAAELSSVAPIVPQMAAGTTDSRFFRERGIAAYGFSPFILNSEFTRTVHAGDERIPLLAFDQGVGRMSRLVARWAAGQDAGGAPSPITGATR